MVRLSGAGLALEEDGQRQDQDGQGEREDGQRDQDPEVRRVALEHVRVGLAGLPARRLRRGFGRFCDIWGARWRSRLFGHAGTIPEGRGARNER